MKHNLVERVLVGILLVVAGGIVLHAPISVWLGTVLPDYAVYIKAWKEVLMGVALVLLITAAVQRKQFDAFMHDKVICLALVYAGLHFLMVGVFQNGLAAAGAGLLIDLRFVLYFVLMYGTLRLFPQWRKLFVKAFAVGAAVVLGFALLQMFVLPKDVLKHIGYSRDTILPYMTVDENPDYIRINSTLRGPNPLGAYAVIVLGILTALTIRWRLKDRAVVYVGVTALAAGLVLGSSHSRSSVGGAILAVAVIIGIAATAKVRKHLAIAGAVLAVVTAGLIYVLRDHPVVSNLVLHDSPTTGASIDSNSAHVESLVEGIDRMVRQPLGAGVGSTGSASLHSKETLILENHYLFVAHEVGWLGLVLFVWLFVEVMRRLWLISQRTKSALALGLFGSGVGLAAIGLLLPVWADDTVSIVWWGLAGLAIGYSNMEYGKVKGKEKHARKND